MTAQQLSAICGAVVSLAFSYIPGLRTWYGKQSGDVKRLIMLGVLVVVAAAIFGLSCWGVIDNVTCDRPGAVGLALAVFYAVAGNQAIFLITPFRNGGR